MVQVMKNDLIKLSDDDLRQLQRKSLEIAKYVINFCKDRNIRVYFFAGSLLGAVRHNGFIPWDDDIDMIFPAPDFEKFIKAWEKDGDKEKYSLCIQTKSYNDHTLSGSIRDNNTTFITDSTINLDVNQGLAIDIDALHACPNSKVGQIIQLFFAAGRSLFKAGRVPARQSKIVCLFAKLILSVFRSSKIRYFMWHSMEQLASISDKNYNHSKYVREFTMFPFITWLYPREWFEKMEWVKFEDTEVPIPVGARGYLEKRYGDYMQIPPEKDRHPEHRIVFLDLETPYREYRGKKYFMNDKNENDLKYKS